MGRPAPAPADGRLRDRRRELPARRRGAQRDDRTREVRARRHRVHDGRAALGDRRHMRLSSAS